MLKACQFPQEGFSKVEWNVGINVDTLSVHFLVDSMVSTTQIQEQHILFNESGLVKENLA